MSINYAGVRPVLAEKWYSVRAGRMPVQRKEGSLKICVLTVFL